MGRQIAEHLNESKIDFVVIETEDKLIAIGQLENLNELNKMCITNGHL